MELNIFDFLPFLCGWVILFDYPCWSADDNAVVGEGAPHDGIGADDALFAENRSCLYRCTIANKAVFADRCCPDQERLLQDVYADLPVVVVDIGDENVP